MNKKAVLTYLCIGIMAATLIPLDVFGVTNNTSSNYGGDVIVTHAKSMKDLLFGPGMYLVSILSCAWSVIEAFFTQAFKRIAFFMGVGLTAGVMPQFLEKVFSLMLP
jgi:hypothetical protein